MTTISAVIITLNEEHNIQACLECLDWVDEIVVLDSGSQDRTEEICRRYTDRFHFRSWTGYSDQRNAAHDLAAGDWILSLDADERVTRELADEIRSTLRNPEGNMAGYFVLRKVFWGRKWLRHGGFYPEKRLRLFKKDLGFATERAVHETIEVSGPTRTLKHHLLHYTYRSIDDYLDRMIRYAGLSAREYHEQGRRTGPLRMSGHALFNFARMYILQRGFLDGYHGFLAAVLYSFYTFVKYARLKEITDGDAE